MDLKKAICYYGDDSGKTFFCGRRWMLNLDLSPDVFCHNMHYAGGGFEGIRGMWDEKERELYLITLPEHLQRLSRTSNFMGLMPIDTVSLAERTMQLVANNVHSGFLDPTKGCYIRHLIYKDRKLGESGEQEPGLGVYSGGHKKVMTISLFPWGAYLESTNVRVFEQGIDSPLRQHKCVANYGFNGLAKNTAVDNGFDEALITDTTPDRNVLEGGGENVFIFGDGEIITPSTDQAILPGTKRQITMEIIRAYGGTVEERKIPLDEFMTAPAAAFTGTAAGFIGIQSVFNPLTEREQTFDPNHPIVGDITVESLAEIYQNVVSGKEVDPRLQELQRRIRTPVNLEARLKKLRT